MDYYSIKEMEDEYLWRKTEIKTRKRAKEATSRKRGTYAKKKNNDTPFEMMSCGLKDMEKDLEKLDKALKTLMELSIPLCQPKKKELECTIGIFDNHCNSVVIDSNLKETLSVEVIENEKSQDIEKISEPTIPSLAQDIVEKKREEPQEITSGKGILITSKNECEVRKEVSNLLTLNSTNPNLTMQVHWSFFRARMPKELTNTEPLFLTDAKLQNTLIWSIPKASKPVCKFYCFVVYLFSNYLYMCLIECVLFVNKFSSCSNLSISESMEFCEYFGQRDVNKQLSRLVSPHDCDFSDFIWTNFEDKFCSYPQYFVQNQIALYDHCFGERFFRILPLGKVHCIEISWIDFTTNNLFVARCLAKQFLGKPWSASYSIGTSAIRGMQRFVFDPGARRKCCMNYILILNEFKYQGPGRINVLLVNNSCPLLMYVNSCVNSDCDFFIVYITSYFSKFRDVRCLEKDCPSYLVSNMLNQIENFVRIGTIAFSENLWFIACLNNPLARSWLVYFSGNLAKELWEHIPRAHHSVFDSGGDSPQTVELLIDLILIIVMQDSRSNLFQEKGIDTSMDPRTHSGDEVQLPNGPIMRAKAKKVNKRMKVAMESLIMTSIFQEICPSPQEALLINLLQACATQEHILDQALLASDHPEQFQ